ncbi:MAG: CHAT domain-containing protein [Acidobacteria bacterium]|nr:CHAT domain-containing protein [Acidobacteriota bacterium]
MQDLVLKLTESSPDPARAWTAELWDGFPGCPGTARRAVGRRAFTQQALEADSASGALDRDTVLDKIRTEDLADQIFGDIGVRLYDVLDATGIMPELDAWRAAARALPETAARPCLYLDLPPWLDEWPWELLAWRNGTGADAAFMLDRTPVARLGPHPSCGWTWSERTVRVLLVPGQEHLDATDGSALASAELRLIRKAFHQAGVSALVERCEVPADIDELEQRLAEARPHILHFIGHGEIDTAAQQPEFALQFRSTRAPRGAGAPVPWEWSITQIRQFFLNNWRPRLVVLNACHSAQGGEQATPVLEALLDAGVPAVIGAQAALDITYARRFAERFYEALASGLPLHRAMVRARHLLSTFPQYAGNRRRHWALPVLTVRVPVEQVLRFTRANAAITQCEIAREVYARPGRFVNRTSDRRTLLGALRPAEEGAPALRGVIVESDISGVGKDWLMKRSVRDFLDNDFVVRHATLVGPQARSSIDVLQEWRGLPSYAASPMCAPLPAAPFVAFDEAVKAARAERTARNIEEVVRTFKAGLQEARRNRPVLLILGRFRSLGQNWVTSEDFREHLLEKLLLPIASVEPEDPEVSGLHALLVVRQHSGVETGQPADFDEFALQRVSAAVPDESRRLPGEGFRRVRVAGIRKTELDSCFDEFTDFRDHPMVTHLRMAFTLMVQQDSWLPSELNAFQDAVKKIPAAGAI